MPQVGEGCWHHPPPAGAAASLVPAHLPPLRLLAHHPCRPAAFAEDRVRKQFVRRVFSLVFIQLCITVGVACVFLFVQPVRVGGWVAGWGWTVWQGQQEGRRGEAGRRRPHPALQVQACRQRWPLKARPLLLPFPVLLC